MNDIAVWENEGGLIIPKELDMDIHKAEEILIDGRIIGATLTDGVVWSLYIAKGDKIYNLIFNEPVEAVEIINELGV